MRHDPTFWLLARASGLTAYVMLTFSVLAGLVLKSRPFRSLKPAAVTDLHRILAMLGLGFLVGHAVALVLDTTVKYVGATVSVVVKTLTRLAPDDTVYTNGAGNFAGWMHRYIPYVGQQHHGRTQLAPTSGAMGYGVPAAVAAALLHPERTVVNIAGDGDFLMTGQELATATGYGARRLLSIVVDNGSYGTIRMHQEREYPERVSGTELQNPDFAALARAYGWRAARIDRSEDFEAAFGGAMTAGAPMPLRALVLPCLAATLMFGPAGLLLFLLLSTANRRWPRPVGVAA